MTLHDSPRWVDEFDNLIYNYNHTVNSAIGIEPVKVTKANDKSILKDMKEKFIEQVGLSTQHINVGDHVRLPILKTAFSKEGPKYSETIYEVINTNGSKVWVKNNGHNLKTPYNINQVLRVDKDMITNKKHAVQDARKEAKVERIIRKEGLEVDREPKQYSARKAKIKAYQKLLH